MSFLRFVDQRVGNVFDGGFTVAIGFIEVRFHADQVDDAAKPSFAADGQLQRDNIAAKNSLQRFHGALEAGEFAVHPGKDKGARNIVLNAVVPHFFGGDLRANVRIDGDQGGVGSDQR